jgi:hypothetical protein
MFAQGRVGQDRHTDRHTDRHIVLTTTQSYKTWVKDVLGELTGKTTLSGQDYFAQTKDILKGDVAWSMIF